MADDATTSPPEANPTPADDAAAKAALQKQCDDEHATYLKERESLIKNELETEKGYDTLLVTLSTLAIGSSFTILKDIVRTRSGSSLIILAWIAFGLCLFIALADKLLSYWTHKWFREALDTEMLKRHGRLARWNGRGAQYGNIRFMWLPPKLKIAAAIALLLGVVFLLLFVFVATAAPTTDDKQQQQPSPPPVIVNVYNTPPTTGPTMVQTPTTTPIAPSLSVPLTPKTNETTAAVAAPTTTTAPTTNRAADATVKP